MRARSFILGFTFVAMCVALTPRAVGQCFPTWADNGVLMPTSGPGSAVSDAAMWDPDGGGPLAQVMVVGGIDGVFSWDGAEWNRVGEYGQSPTIVRHVAILNNQPVVRGELGGTFGAVARWTGSGWLLMGNPGGNMFELTTYNGALIAAGDLLTADGTSTHNIIRWDGAAWHAMGTGLPARCTALAVYDSIGGAAGTSWLYAGCIDGSVHRWDGAAWQTLPSVGSSEIEALAGHNGLLYAASTDGVGTTNRRLFTWAQGAAGWTNVAGVFQRDLGSSGEVGVHSMRSWNGSLIVGGAFDHVAASSSRNITKLTGATWSSMSTGLGLIQPWFEVNAIVPASASILYAVGDFYDTPEPSPKFVRHTASWNGSTWSPLVSPGQVLALTPFGSRMAIGGNLSTGSVVGSATPIHQIALWDGLTLSPLGGGVSTNASVRAMREFGSNVNTRSLVVGGDFTSVSGAGAGPASRIAKWNQSELTPLQSGWTAMGSGFNGSVQAVEIDGNGVLVAGGAFTASGATTLNRVAKWNGGAWVPYAISPTTDMNGTVRALKAYLPNPISAITRILIAGGDFTTANGVTVNRIATWTDSLSTGTTPWTAMGPGFNGSVYAIERYNNSTYAAGAFTMTGAFNVNKIARWNGTSWLVVGNGIGFDGPVFALKAYGNALYAAGAFTNIDGLPARNIAKWDGTSWSPITANADDVGRFVINAYNGEVLIGGNALCEPNHFSYQVDGVERYLPTGVPWFVKQPSPQTRDCGQTATFTVTLAEGYFAQYGWRRNGVPLTNGTTPHGSVISMNTSGTLSIINARSADAGDYDCVCASTCGNITSSIATLTVNTCCIGDIAPVGALDGQVNVSDLIAVITSWGACANCASCTADIAPTIRDCQVNVSDLLAVITSWGPCP